MRHDPNISKETRDIYLKRMTDYMTWVTNAKQFTADQVLNFLNEEYHHLPNIADYISFKSHPQTKTNFGSSSKKQTIYAFEYLCKVRASIGVTIS